ncbi:MAG: hypothetical protein ABI645_10115 [Pseudomonadota bacterium]
MNSRNDIAVRIPVSLATLCISLLWVAPAQAGLKDTPPKNFDAGSIGAWLIDPARSDEPKPILDKAREKIAAGRGASGRPNRGDMGGAGGSGGPGAGRPSGGRRGAGGGNRGQPGGQSQGGPSPEGRAGGAVAVGQLLDDLAHNPPTLKVERADQRVKVLSDEHASTCRAGATATFSDSIGSGERRCGWSGSAWVVETTRGSDLTRTDRYEPARDGKTLTFVTTISGARLPKIKIFRTYVRAGQ